MLVFIPRSASLHFFNGLRYNPRLKQKFVSLVENTTWVIAMKGFRSGFDHFSFSYIVLYSCLCLYGLLLVGSKW